MLREKIREKIKYFYQKYRNSPSSWVPSLYVAEGIPYAMAMTVSVVLYKRLGISNTDIAFYTSWLYLPWVIKPLWSPFVDLFMTKRYWILLTQLLIGASLACIALTIPAARFFQYTLAFFWLMALVRQPMTPPLMAFTCWDFRKIFRPPLSGCERSSTALL